MINWDHCRKEIVKGLDAYILKLCERVATISVESLTEWKNKVLEPADKYIFRLKGRTKRQHTNPVLKQSSVIDYLNSFHAKFVMTPIDKAASNVAVICKMYYA